MKDAQLVFERHEKKYMFGLRQFSALYEALLPHMEPDRYGSYTICSIYLDTDDYTVARHSLDKPAYKEKMRLRSYGTPGPEDTVFLELKKKYGGVTYKRRMALRLQEAKRYLEQGIAPEDQGQIFGEIDWFVKRNRIQPKVMLCYDRVALSGKEDQNLRVTFDAGVRWRTGQLDLGKGDHGRLLIRPDERLMEIKTTNTIPFWLSEILSAHDAYPASFSKYGTVYTQHLQTEEEIRYVG